MISRENDRIYVQGSVTFDNVTTITQQGIALFDGSNVVIDLVKVVEVDSSIVSLMLEWSREANRQQHQIHFINLSESLLSLVRLYGIEECLPLVPQGEPTNLSLVDCEASPIVTDQTYAGKVRPVSIPLDT